MTWRDKAACRGAPVSTFFAEVHSARYRDAAAICATCPVIRACRNWCDDVEERTRNLHDVHGFVGGESPAQRIERRSRDQSLDEQQLTNSATPRPK